MHTNTHVTGMLRSAAMGCALALSSWLLVSCGDDKPVGTPVFVAGAPATNGVFDAALTQDGSGGLWMSYSTVNVLPSDPILLRVNTRIASSSNAGSNWTDAGVTLNTPSDVQVPDNQGLTTSAVWQYEVSRILYDPYANPSPNWKIFWHRYPQANRSAAERLFQHGWIGVATASAPTGPWSPERKLFVGTGYDTANNATTGVPDYTPATLAPSGQLNGCPVFSEPGALATVNGIYISLKCAGGSTDKVVLLRCNNDLTGCVYRQDVLYNTEAAQFSSSSQSYNGFSATELVTVGTTNYLIVTPTLTDAYRGCFVFQVANLDAVSPAPILERVGNTLSGAPVLKKSLSGTPSSFNGACGYAPAASASGIIYGEIQILQGNVLQFGLYRSGVTLP